MMREERIKHVVLFKLNLESDERDRHLARIKRELEELVGAIESLLTLEVEININPQEQYDFMLTAIVEDMKQLEAYAQHPLHQKVVRELIAPHLLSRACVDVICK